MIIHSRTSPLQIESSNAMILYNTLAHLYTQSGDPFYSFYLFKKDTSNSIAWIHFNQIDDSLVSLPMAPFGGIESQQEIAVTEIQFLLECIDEYVFNNKLKSVSIKSSISCYLFSETANYTDLYLRNRFDIELEQENHVIPVSNVPFESLISNSELRRLRKCRRHSFNAQQISEPLTDKIYDFLSKARRNKGYSLTISQETLRRLLSRFPEQVLVFVVVDSDEIIALTIAVKAAKNVLYNFQPATSIRYENFSPMVFLTDFLYTFCQLNNISYLDLGTSCDHLGLPKPGLLKFKKNLGGIPFSKYTFTKQY